METPCARTHHPCQSRAGAEGRASSKAATPKQLGSGNPAWRMRSLPQHLPPARVSVGVGMPAGPALHPPWADTLVVLRGLSVAGMHADPRFPKHFETCLGRRPFRQLCPMIIARQCVPSSHAPAPSHQLLRTGSCSGLQPGTMLGTAPGMHTDKPGQFCPDGERGENTGIHLPRHSHACFKHSHNAAFSLSGRKEWRLC